MWPTNSSRYVVTGSYDYEPGIYDRYGDARSQTKGFGNTTLQRFDSQREAEKAARDAAFGTQSRPCSSGPKYAVKHGLNPGIYDSWAAAAPHVLGYSNNEYKRFDSYYDAEKYVYGTSSCKQNEQAPSQYNDYKPTFKPTYTPQYIPEPTHYSPQFTRQYTPRYTSQYDPPSPRTSQYTPPSAPNEWKAITSLGGTVPATRTSSQSGMASGSGYTQPVYKAPSTYQPPPVPNPPQLYKAPSTFKAPPAPSLPPVHKAPKAHNAPPAYSRLPSLPTSTNVERKDASESDSTRSTIVTRSKSKLSADSTPKITKKNIALSKKQIQANRDSTLSGYELRSREILPVKTEVTPNPMGNHETALDPVRRYQTRSATATKIKTEPL